MLSPSPQNTLKSARPLYSHPSNSAGKADSMPLLTAEQFPRLNERGSIEAITLTIIAASADGFPRLNERGSIEATC